MSADKVRNQCDGCARGLPVNINNHHIDRFGNVYMACSAQRYINPAAGVADDLLELKTIEGFRVTIIAITDDKMVGNVYAGRAKRPKHLGTGWWYYADRGLEAFCSQYEKSRYQWSLAIDSDNPPLWWPWDKLPTIDMEPQPIKQVTA